MGNCWSSWNDEKHVTLGESKKGSKIKSRSSKGASARDDNSKAFTEFKESFDKDMDLYTDVDKFDTDDEEDDDFDSDEITLKRKRNTKELFKKGFMNKVSDHVSPKIRSKYEELGPFRYLKADWKSLELDKNDLEVRAPVEREDGSIYLGQWRIGTEFREGRGVSILSDGALYEGFWKDGQQHGKGRIIYPSQDVYQGDFKFGFSDGFGVYVSESGGKSKGYYKNGKMNGKGFEMWQDGSKYRGDFKNGLKEGNGKFTWNDGSTYNNRVSTLKYNIIKIWTFPLIHWREYERRRIKESK